MSPELKTASPTSKARIFYFELVLKLVLSRNRTFGGRSTLPSSFSSKPEISTSTTMKPVFKLHPGHVLAIILFILLSFPQEVAGDSQGRERALQRQIDSCSSNSDCPNLYYCRIEGSNSPGECKLSWWLILIIVLIGLFFFGGLISCLCSPCCLLYSCCKGVPGTGACTSTVVEPVTSSSRVGKLSGSRQAEMLAFV